MENHAPVENAYGVMALVNNHDWLSHGVLIVLAVMSFFSWYIVATKLWDQRKLSTGFKAVEKTFWTSPSLKDEVMSVEPLLMVILSN